MIAERALEHPATWFRADDDIVFVADGCPWSQRAVERIAAGAPNPWIPAPVGRIDDAALRACAVARGHLGPGRRLLARLLPLRAFCRRFGAAARRAYAPWRPRHPRGAVPRWISCGRWLADGASPQALRAAGL